MPAVGYVLEPRPPTNAIEDEDDDEYEDDWCSNNGKP